MERISPPCRHRSAPLGDGVWACDHPQVLAPNGVELASCMTCRDAGVFCDQEPFDVAPRVRRSADATLLSKPWNLFRSLRAFMADGCYTLTAEEYRRRLMTCTHCGERDRSTCARCGCRLALKARGRAFTCPLGRWQSTDAT